MGLDQRRRQKKLAKQRARRKARAAAQKPSRQGGPSPSRMMATLEFDLASSAPAYECYVADEIFDREKGQGMGQVIVSRLSARFSATLNLTKTNGRMAPNRMMRMMRMMRKKKMRVGHKPFSS